LNITSACAQNTTTFESTQQQQQQKEEEEEEVKESWVNNRVCPKLYRCLIQSKCRPP
jgi:hypothetical protein